MRFEMIVMVLFTVAGCQVTTHPTKPSDMGASIPIEAMERELARPGSVVVETVVAADWAVARSGLINLDHPKARQAGLKDGDEPIQIAFHAIRHPVHGLFLVDTGVEAAWRGDPAQTAVGWLIRTAMNTERLKVRVDTGAWLAAQQQPLKGVFLTHLHLDHVMGLPDIPKDIPIYTGPAEAAHAGWEGALLRGTYDRALAGFAPIHEWRFGATGNEGRGSVVDIFGDRTVFAIRLPGHTAGSTAFAIRTPHGPVLLAGDASHTAWGWNHGVEPGTFNEDKAAAAQSFAWLQALAGRHAGIDVRLGHQSLKTAPPTGVAVAAGKND